MDPKVSNQYHSHHTPTYHSSVAPTILTHPDSPQPTPPSSATASPPPPLLTPSPSPSHRPTPKTHCQKVYLLSKGEYFCQKCICSFVKKTILSSKVHPVCHKHANVHISKCKSFLRKVHILRSNHQTPPITLPQETPSPQPQTLILHRPTTPTTSKHILFVSALNHHPHVHALTQHAAKMLFVLVSTSQHH
jgi:hypothetical protein